MKRETQKRILSALLLIAVGDQSTAGGQTPSRARIRSSQTLSAQTLSTPMRFSEHYECGGTGCTFFILAEGTITNAAPLRFRDFMRRIEGAPVIYFNSPGGDLAAGLELGKAIRSFGLDTFVGGPYVSFRDNPTKEEESTKTLVEKGVCFSACVYAFLGGTSRELGKAGVLGVHQFFGRKGDSGESATQITMTVLSSYLDQMGVDRRLLDIASVTSSHDIEILSLKIAQELNVDNTNPPRGEWQVDVTRSGELFAYVVQKQPRKNAIVSFVLTRSKGSFLGTIRYIIKQKFRSKKELEEAYLDDHRPPRLYREGPRYETKFPLVPVHPWKLQPDGSFTISFSLDARTLSMIAQGQSVTFDASFPNVYRDLDPSVTFSTARLQRVLTALLKRQ